MNIPQALYRKYKTAVQTGILLLSIFCLLGTSSVSASDRKTRQTKPASRKKQMCISIDELPSAESFEEIAPETVMIPIMRALKAHQVKAIGFVVGKNIGRAYDLLGEWLNDGHQLGNLTYSHSDFREMGIEQFLKDIIAGNDALETMLAGFGQKKRYFRFPFLHYGTTIKGRQNVELYLDEHDITLVHASVVVEDYLYNLSLQKLGPHPDSVSEDIIGSEYVAHVLERIEAAEQLSKKLFNRNCRQILQLRANRLNALVLDELLSAIESMGYEFITVDKALRDKVYRSPEAYFGNKGLGYLDMIDQSDPDKLPAQ